MRRLLIALTVTFGTLMVLAVPADAGTYYGHRARSVARAIHCVNFHDNGGGAFNLDSGVCWIRGHRVNVITFRGPGQQRDWNDTAKSFFGPRYFWTSGRGAVVVARNGNRTAAQLGARRLPGTIRHG